MTLTLLDRPFRGTSLGALLLLAFSAPDASGQVLSVTNPGFESPAIPAGTFQTVSPPTGWSVYGAGINFGLRTIGVLHPATTALYTVPVPEGVNVGVVFLLDDPGNQTFFAGIEAGMEQTLVDTLSASTTYTLTVEVGNIANDPAPPNNQFQFAGFPGYRIELLAGGSPIGSDTNSLLPAEGDFLTSTIVVRIGTAHAQLGQPLGVRLVNLNAAPGIEVNFDDVRLVASSSVTYCTAGLSAAQCQASIAATGTPSASAPSGFTLSVTGVEGAKDGLFFLGTNGRQASPWGSGTSFQCVVPPVSRAGLLVGTGTQGQCDGAFAQDLNALWCPTCPKPAKNPGSGALVQAQCWYRDPQNTSNQTTSLSDAIEFVVAP